MIDEHGGHESGHYAVVPARCEFVYQRLGDHEPHPALHVGDGHLHRQWIDHLAGGPVAQEKIADLRTVAVGDDQSVPLFNQVCQRSRRLARIDELLAYVAFLVFLGDRVATQGHDNQVIISHTSEPHKCKPHRTRFGSLGAERCMIAGDRLSVVEKIAVE